MFTTKAVCVVLTAFQTLVVVSNGQTRSPNWDQRFGPRPDFFEQDSNNNDNAGRRNFFNFPQGDSQGAGNDGRRVSSQTPIQIGPSRGASPENEGRSGVPRQIPPSMPQNPTPIGGMDQSEAPPPRPSPGRDQRGPGLDNPPRRGQEPPQQPPTPPVPAPGQRRSAGDEATFSGFNPQSPTRPGPIGESQPPLDSNRGMGQPPSPGQTELMDPRRPPMARTPTLVRGNGEREQRVTPQMPEQGYVPSRRPSEPPAAQIPLNQPPVQPGRGRGGVEESRGPSGGQIPRESGPGPNQRQAGGREMLRDAPRPHKQGRPLAVQVRGAGSNPTVGGRSG